MQTPTSTDNIGAVHNAPSFIDNRRVKTEKKDKLEKKSFFALFSDQAEEIEQRDFERIPEAILSAGHERIVEYLLDEVHSRGDVIRKTQTKATILAYRSAVQMLMRYVVDNAFTVTERKTGSLNPQKRKTFTQIQVIDEKLEQLAAMALYSQTEQLQILVKLEEIYGLLVDLLG